MQRFVINHYIFSDEEAKQETLAIRFANADIAKKFKEEFDSAVAKVTEAEAQRINQTEISNNESDEKKDKKTETDAAAEKLSSLTIKK